MESRIKNCFRQLLHSLQQKKGGSVDKSKSWQQQCAMPLLATSPRNEAKMMGLQNVVQTSELCQMSGGGKHIKKVFYFVLSKRKLLMENQIFFLKKDDRWWKATQRYQPLFIFFFQIYSLTRTVNELLEYKRLKSNFLFDTVVENRTKKSHFLKVRMSPPRIWEGAVRYGRRAIRGDHSFLFIFKYILSGWCQG